MADYAAYINAVERVALREGFTIRSGVNTVGSLSAVIFSEDGTYRPPMQGTIVVQDESVSPPDVLFGGYVTTAEESGFAGIGDGIATIGTRVTALDYNTITQRLYANTSIASGNLKAAATVLVALMSSYGVTLHASQANGPDLPDITFEYVLLKDALDQLTRLSLGWTWWIDYDKVLRFTEPGTQLAPWDLIEGEGSEVGDVVVEPALDDEYANRIIVIGEHIEEVERIDTFTGDGIEDTFEPTYTVERTYGYITSAGIFETLGLPGDPASPTWTYDPATGLFTRSSPPGSGETVEIKYDGSTDISAQADDAGEQASRGLWERVERVTGITTLTQAQAYADAVLEERISDRTTVTYHTRRTGLVPGQVQTVTVPLRNVNADFLITEVSSQFDEGTDLVFKVHAVKGQFALGTNARSVVENWSRQGSGSGGGTTQVGTVLPSNTDLLRVSTVTLTHAQIQDLPNTHVDIVPAPGVGYRVKPIAYSVMVDAAAGAYAVDADARLFFAYDGDETNALCSSYVLNDSASPALTYLTDLLNGSVTIADPVLRALTDTALGLVNESFTLAYQENVPVSVAVVIPGSPAGEITGGNAANTMTVRVYYVVEALIGQPAYPPVIQVFASLIGPPGFGATGYCNPFNQSSGWHTGNEAPARHPWAVDGTLRNLAIHMSATSGTNQTFTLRQNGSDTALTVTVTAGQTYAEITGTDVAVVAGDQLSLSSQSFGLTTDITVGIEFEATNVLESGYATSAGAPSGTVYNGLLRGATGWVATESDAPNVAAIAGTVESIYFRLEAAPTAGNSRTFTIFKNGVAQDGSGGTPDTRVTIADAATTGNATFSLTVAVGDLLSVRSVPTGSPANSFVQYACGFLGTEHGYSHFCGRTTGGPDVSSASYADPTEPDAGWDTTETDVDLFIPCVTGFELSRLVMRSINAPGSGKSVAFVGRLNAATPSGAPNATLSDTATTTTSGGGSMTVDPDDLMTIQATPTGTPSSPGSMTWAFAQRVP